MTLSNLLIIFIFVPCVLSTYPLERNLRLNSVNNVAELAAPVNEDDYRLPKSISPSTYDLLIVPFFDNFNFYGETTITVTVQNSTSQIVLNQKKLQIQSVTVTDSASAVVQSTFTTNDTLERLIITTNTLNVSAQSYTVKITYNGTLSQDMLGFYRSSYVENNQTKWLAITQFESTYARQAFPCFDEPAFRAKFTLRIGYDKDKGFITLSNYPRLNTSEPLPDLNNKTVDLYEQTPAMPTYLVAFSVNQFSHQQNGNFGIYMRPDVEQQGTYLNSIGQKILDTIGDFLGLKYPLPKMDVVAVPDFDAGAMENWGLTTYREKYVLYDSNVNSVSDQQLLVAVVAHEFGHQWFGDLVTPEWWDYTWLNEAFATYFEYVTPNILEPTWGMMDQFNYDNLQSSLANDVGSPRPMTSSVYTPEQIDSIFDYVIYEKGGSILRMTEHFLTTDVWKAGLLSYLQENQYKTGNPGSLFNNLENAAANKNVVPEGVQVSNIMKSWTEQGGYPILHVNTSTTPFTITQAPFALDAKYENQTWFIPLTYTTAAKPDFDTTHPSNWLVPGNAAPNISNSDNTSWVIFNIQQIGFYRVNYDDANWQKLTDQMNANHSLIASNNRGQLLDDSFKLARYGYLDYSVPLGLTKYLLGETDYIPWMSAANNINYLALHLYGTDIGTAFRTYAYGLLTNNFMLLTGNKNSTEPHLTTLLRMNLVNWACNWGHPSCESYANNLFQQWFANQTGVVLDTDIKQTVFCTGLRLNSDTNDTFLAVWNYYLNSNNYADKLAVMYSLGCTTSESALNLYLSFLIGDGNEIRRQDKWIVFRAVVQKQTGISVALKFLVDNYQTLIEKIGTKRVGSMISSLAANIVQQAHIDEISSVISNSTILAELRSRLNNTLPGIQERKAWATQYSPDINSWISANTDRSSANIVSSTFILNISLITIASFYFKFFISA